MSKADFETLQAQIEAVDPNTVLTPNLPIDTALQEAEDLYQWTQSDKEALTGNGLNWELVESLQGLAGACRHLQSLWQLESNMKDGAQKEWEIAGKAAFEMRDDTITTFRYAFRKEEDLIQKLSEIDEGFTNADMVQDLSDLAAMGKANTTLLEAMNYDLAQLDVLAAKAEAMGTLLAQANGDRFAENETLVKRNQAYTLLKEAVDEIRDCGKYTFRKNPDRAKGYSSAYGRRYNRKRQAAANEETETTL